MCSTHQNPHCSKYITIFQKTIRLIADNSLIWHFRLPIKTLLAYQRKQIYSEASSTHFSAINLSYFTLYPSKSSLFQIHYIRHFRKLSELSWNRIQFDTLWLPIKTLLTSQRKQIYSEASSTHFSAINLSYLRFTIKIIKWFQIHHYISENYQTYRGTLSITNITSRPSTFQI